jgi:hypothetical protein
MIPSSQVNLGDTNTSHEESFQHQENVVQSKRKESPNNLTAHGIDMTILRQEAEELNHVEKKMLDQSATQNRAAQATNAMHQAKKEVKDCTIHLELDHLKRSQALNQRKPVEPYHEGQSNHHNVICEPITMNELKFGPSTQERHPGQTNAIAENSILKAEPKQIILMLDLRCLCCHHHNPGNLS